MGVIYIQTMMSVGRVFLLFVFGLVCIALVECVDTAKSGSPVEFPKDLTPLFEKDGNRLILNKRFLLPKKTGKFEMKLPKTKASLTAFHANLSSNYQIKADVSVDGRITSKFGYFGYSIDQMLERGSHSMIFFLTQLNEVKEFYRDYPSASIDDEDIPVIEVYMVVSTEESDMDSVQKVLDSMQTQSISEEV